MLIGTMNHPGRDLIQEVRWIAGLDFDFVDLTFEPPLASPRTADLRTLKTLLADHQMSIVGHTAYYLPLCSPFESIRRAAVDELKVCLEAFATLGASWMNLHPDRQAPMHDRPFIIERNLATIRDLEPLARDLGIGLMIENLPGSFNSVAQLAELLDPLPNLGFHLDIGHANLLVEVNTTEELLAAFGPRLRHVHLHDNKGGSADLHLPLGCGTVDTKRSVRALQAAGYDGTITLEVFTPDRRHLVYSRDLLREVWNHSKQAGLASAASR